VYAGSQRGLFPERGWYGHIGWPRGQVCVELIRTQIWWSKMTPFSMDIFFQPSSELSLRRVFEIGSCDEPKNRDSIDY
jgi:hypothetical protein